MHVNAFLTYTHHLWSGEASKIADIFSWNFQKWYWIKLMTLSKRDPITRKDLNIQTLWDVRPMYVVVCKLFCMNRRYSKI